jgi:hypothetical protein
MWMGHWPISALWTLINDPVRKALKAIYARIAGTLQRISDHLFSDIKDDFSTHKMLEKQASETFDKLTS